VLRYMQASCLIVSFSSPPDAPRARRAADRLAGGAPAVRTDLGQRPLHFEDRLRQVGDVMEAHGGAMGVGQPAT
jgi:hypothetical protein